MGRLYQSKYKNEFMESHPKSRRMYEWLFDKAFDYETRFGKDLFDFNKDQILEFYLDRKMTYNTLYTQIGFLSTYINWAITKGYTLLKRNPIDDIEPDDLRRIAKPDNNVLHVDTIYEIVGKENKSRIINPLKNAQDRLLIYLLFLGVLGKRANELTNLRFEHIENGLIKLSEINKDRKDITIDEFGMNLVEIAKRETYYERYQSDDRRDYNDHDYDLIDSGYVFRKSMVGNYKGDKMSYQALLSRMIKLSEYTGHKLTMYRVMRSGMVYVGKLILDSKGELSKDDPVVIKSIFERYNIQGEDNVKLKILRYIRKEIEAVYGEVV